MSEINLQEIKSALSEAPIQCICEAEKKYFNDIDDCVKRIICENKKILLIAGPSGSGKTTTANFIKGQLEALGHKTILVSMDNFYRSSSDPDYPRSENGMLDYESVEALRTELIHDCIEKLIGGRMVSLPRYVFGEGRIEENAYNYTIPDGGVFIMEGIHGLNPIFIDGLPSEKIFRLFVSVSTNINDNGKRILSGKKIRFIRRMTRDSIYRGASAGDTLERWQSVLTGEEKYLYPYRDTADMSFDTFHMYEISAMKALAEKEIRKSYEEGTFVGEYADVIRSALEKFESIKTELVPRTSLIREFISGGVFDEIY